MNKPWNFDDDDLERDDFEDFEEKAWSAVKPEELYFAFSTKSDVQGGIPLVLIVCPKEYWDKEKAWFDQTPFMDLVTDKWPKYLREAMEAVYELKPPATEAQCKKD